MRGLFRTGGGAGGRNGTANLAPQVAGEGGHRRRAGRGEGQPAQWVIGKDTRISSDMLESALMAGICSVGGDVKPLGTIPTPRRGVSSKQERADAGIVISASHNPYEHNGIKVFSGQGYKLLRRRGAPHRGEDPLRRPHEGPHRGRSAAATTACASSSGTILISWPPRWSRTWRG